MLSAWFGGLQMTSDAAGRPKITGPVADQAALHTYGNVLDTQWVTIHDTAVDGTASFNANTLAKAKGGAILHGPKFFTQPSPAIDKPFA